MPQNLAENINRVETKSLYQYKISTECDVVMSHYDVQASQSNTLTMVIMINILL